MLISLLVDPKHALAQEIFKHSLSSRPRPLEVDHQHGHADIAEDLDCFEDSTLVGIELLGHRSDVRLAADFNDGV